MPYTCWVAARSQSSGNTLSEACSCLSKACTDHPRVVFVQLPEYPCAPLCIVVVELPSTAVDVFTDVSYYSKRRELWITNDLRRPI